MLRRTDKNPSEHTLPGDIVSTTYT